MPRLMITPRATSWLCMDKVTQQKYLSLQHMCDAKNGNSGSFVVKIQHLGVHVEPETISQNYMIKIQEKSINQDGGWRNGARGNYVGDIIVADIKPKNRIESIDLLRGIVMIIMAIDHVRDYFHFDAFLYSPVDISQTSAGLFITRWITHLCAPTFIFLAGVSTYFVAQKKTLSDTSFFLLTRGIWLVLLQLTLIRFFWNFDPLFRYNSNTIISTIGICMIVLSGLIYLRIRTIFFIGIVMVVGHNLLDGISFKEGTLADVLWSFLHVQKSFDLGGGYAFTFLYPVIPWVGVMALGYCFGSAL